MVMKRTCRFSEKFAFEKENLERTIFVTSIHHGEVVQGGVVTTQRLDAIVPALL